MKLQFLIPIVSWSVLAIFYKLAVGRIHPITMQLVSCCIGVALIPIYLHILSVEKALVWNTTGMILAVLAGVVSAIGSISYLYLLKSYDVSEVLGFTSAYPILTFIFSIFIFNEQINLKKAVGFFMVLFGIWILNNGIKKW